MCALSHQLAIAITTHHTPLMLALAFIKTCTKSPMTYELNNFTRKRVMFAVMAKSFYERFRKSKVTKESYMQLYSLWCCSLQRKGIV